MIELYIMLCIIFNCTVIYSPDCFEANPPAYLNVSVNSCVVLSFSCAIIHNMVHLNTRN